MIIASNQIYKIKNKGFLYDKVKSIFMLVVLILLLTFIIIVPIFGDFIIKWITSIIDSTTINGYITSIYQIINLPLSQYKIHEQSESLVPQLPELFNSFPQKSVDE